MPANVGHSFDTLEIQAEAAESVSEEKLSPAEARRTRLDLHKRQRQDLIEYLQTKKCRPGLDKREVRNNKNKAATHAFDATSRCSSRDFPPFV